MKQIIEKHPKIVAMLFFCMLVGIFSYSANYEKYSTTVGIGARRALSNANATTSDGGAEGSAPRREELLVGRVSH